MKVAMLVDGGFYRKRAYNLVGDLSPKERADELEQHCKRHINDNKKENCELYRIFYYDCPPVKKNVFHPLKRTTVDFSKTPQYTWTCDFYDELRKRRKFALRLGVLASESVNYNLKQETTKKLMNGMVRLDELTDMDFSLNLKQKGVDMRIGIDIASLAFKKQVDRIILIAGDSDFVPAAKLARREGIDFILDPMHNSIRDDLFEHIDGIRSKAPKKQIKNNKTK